MKYLILLFSISIPPLSASAEKGPSIMFGDPDPIHQEKTPDMSTEEHNEQCKQLRRQIQELKGKPQRRHAVVERYRLECQPPAE